MHWRRHATHALMMAIAYALLMNGVATDAVTPTKDLTYCRRGIDSQKLADGDTYAPHTWYENRSVKTNAIP